MNIHVFYTGIIPLKLSKKKIKDSKAKGTCTCSFHFDQRSSKLLYQILQLIKRPETPEMNEY